MTPARLGWAIGGAVALVIISALAWGLGHAAQRAPADVLGRPAPDLTIRSLQDGRQVRLSDLHGRPVVLNFWASWCVPCRQEAPALNEAARRYDGRILFLGADIEDSEQPARAYLGELQVAYPAGPIVRGSERDYGVTAPPETFFIDRQGVVAARILGAVDAKRLEVYIGLVRP